jgi:hypothetical protein
LLGSELGLVDHIAEPREDVVFEDAGQLVRIERFGPLRLAVGEVPRTMVSRFRRGRGQDGLRWQ